MILATRIFRRTGLLMGCTALAACMGSSTTTGTGGGGGGGGAALTPAAFALEFDRVGALGPTTDMPRTGTANFAGAAHATLNRGATQVGDLMGDIEMSVNFAAAAATATETSALSGKISKIRGTVDGKDVSFDGELTTANAKARSLDSLARITTTTINAPVVGPITTHTGSLMGNFAGDLKIGSQSGPVVVQTGGNFFGPGAQGAAGTVAGTWWDPGNPSAYTVGGRFFVDRQ